MANPVRAGSPPGPVPTLVEVLADFYPTQGDIQRVLVDARQAPGRFALNDSAINIWSKVLERARDNGQLWDLVRIPLKEYPNNQDLSRAWENELAERRAALPQTGGDTAMSLLIDMVWNLNDKQDKQGDALSALRHESRNRLTTLELLTASLKAFYEGQAADIAALKERPETYSTRVVLALALLVGALGGLFAAWGRMIWQSLSRLFGG